MGADQGLTRLFYDGDCGFCSGAARFVARHDSSGRIHFAPLFGSTFTRLVPASRWRGLPDSLVVLTPEGELLTRSEAAIHVLKRMGPAWRRVGVVLAWIPTWLRDGAYRFIAWIRPARRACPMDKAVLDERFEA
ncbi:hypothetical protein GETHLI_15900 [Geothrix limicola]|uniref:DUF393 domain-containing protein n=1 Tax=Geothrix limicola TaxID=2927978 RepID=A0ABQ5QEJ3_9BACT|nr:DUF393 domain-containing protein [Geothrix limicola]GLH73088.1 hypothetical protein GETHLI_15900 [Geothrix limicola]